MYIAPLSAEAPDNTEEAPFTTSICLMFSTGIKAQSGLPASPVMIGISSIKTPTFDPTPKVKPLPPLICGSSSKIVTPGVKSKIVSTDRVFLASIKRGFITSIEAVCSSSDLSNRPALTTTSSNCVLKGSISTCRLVVLLLSIVTEKFTVFIPVNEMIKVYSPGSNEIE